MHVLSKMDIIEKVFKFNVPEKTTRVNCVMPAFNNTLILFFLWDDTTEHILHMTDKGQELYRFELIK
jgi:hypothetical protein